MRIHQLVAQDGMRTVLPNLTAIDAGGHHYTPPPGATCLCYCGLCFLLWWETEHDDGGGWCPNHQDEQRQRYLSHWAHDAQEGAVSA